MNGLEQFFNFVVARPTAGFHEMGGFNWPLAGCVVFFYVLCALTLWKGIKILEKTSYVTVPLPYVVVAIFFGRVFFMEGSYDGIKKFLFNADLSKLQKWKTWKTALTQLCFSLALGFGVLPSLSSHSRKSNNFLRDAFLVVAFDSLMSIVGGVAVFGTLGSLAFYSGKDFEKVVDKGLSLAFIAYPEATASMPIEWVWNLLFFIMLFLLGFSSLIGIIDTVSTCLLDTYPKLKKSKKWKALVPCLLCSFLCAIGLFFCTGNGFWWFDLLSEFTGETTPSISVAVELVIVAYCYRFANVQLDMEEMWGKMPESRIRRLFSRFSSLFKWNWLLISPVFAIVVAVCTVIRQNVPHKTESGYTYPIWAEVFGWLINLGPTLIIPVFFFINWMTYRKKNIAFKYLFMPSKDMPSHDRYYKNKGIPPPEGWNKEPGEKSAAETSESNKV